MTNKAKWLAGAAIAAAILAGPVPGRALPERAGSEAERPAGPQITIYNQDFALVKETRSLSLNEGLNEIRVTDVTALLEPDSVILRDPRDPGIVRVIEQNYEANPLSEGYLLEQYEGKTISFKVTNPKTGLDEIRTGRVVRSGYAPFQGGGVATPIIEMDGKIQFRLPGLPLFDAPGADAILKPTLLWRLQAVQGGKREVEFSYLTGGLGWGATYNVVAPEKGDRFDLVGWVTLTNRSGAGFREARLKLMAGDVHKIQPGMRHDALAKSRMMEMAAAEAPAVTEKAFDEYHLYTLQRPTTIRDQETKQVEFCRGSDVPGARLYVYDGARTDKKVETAIEFTNSKAAGLGMALPRGTMKIYRADTDGRREFIGEDAIDHTPADEKVRVRLGTSFDLAGERRQTEHRVDSASEWADEAFEIKLRNHKKEPVEIRVVEHLYRWTNWKIALSSDPWTKADSKTIEFRVNVPPDGQKVVTYKVHYSW